MASDGLGHLFRFTSFCDDDFCDDEEPADGCVIQGMPAGVALAGPDLARLGAGRTRILSGVRDGVTTGAPIHLTAPRAAAPMREAAVLVAAGAVARRLLGHLVPGDVRIRGAVVGFGPHAVSRSRWDWAAVGDNAFRCPDRVAAAAWDGFAAGLRRRRSSAGGVVEIVAENVPVGLGAPVYDKLDADVAKAMLTMDGVTGVEIGAGFTSACLSGEENADEMRMGNDGGVRFLSNNAGGILGGLSSGQPIDVRLAVRPAGHAFPCVAAEMVPVAEALLAVVLADHLLRHRAQIGPEPGSQAVDCLDEMGRTWPPPSPPRLGDGGEGHGTG